MGEKVIITLSIPRDHWEMDFEVPTFLSCTELGKRLLSSLREMDGMRFRSWERVRFRFKGRLLDNEKTLYHYGVWDGSILEITQ